MIPEFNSVTDLGSRFRCFFDPWIRDRFFPGSRISDPGSPTHSSVSLVTILWVKSKKYLKYKELHNYKLSPPSSFIVVGFGIRD